MTSNLTGRRAPRWLERRDSAYDRWSDKRAVGAQSSPTRRGRAVAVVLRRGNGEAGLGSSKRRDSHNSHFQRLRSIGWLNWASDDLDVKVYGASARSRRRPQLGTNNCHCPPGVQISMGVGAGLLRGARTIHEVRALRISPAIVEQEVIEIVRAQHRRDFYHPCIAFV